VPRAFEIAIGERRGFWFPVPMNINFRRLLLLTLLTTAFSASALAQGRIATIDLRKVFDNYYKTKLADAKLKDDAAEMDKENKGFLDDFKKANEDYQKLLASASDSALSADERDKRKAAAEKKLGEIKELKQTIEQYQQTATTTLAEKKRRLRDNILEEIRGVLNTKARSANYTLVIDTAAETVNNTPVVLFNAGESDLTDAILSQLNANAPTDLPKPADASTNKDGEKKTEKK
jgi:outer membrane protein